MADDDTPITPLTGWRLLLAKWMARFVGYKRNVKVLAIYQGETLIWKRDADEEERTDG